MSDSLQKPSWLKVKAPKGERYLHLKKLLKELNLVTVCEEAQCPNVAECWGGGTATFMLMGEVCTRGCRFCAVRSGKQGESLDPKEPEKVSWAISQMNLDYVVITSVDRDDLPDQGANHFAHVVKNLRQKAPELIVEILTPDFSGKKDLIESVAQAHPHVFAHNIETVERLTPRVRDRRAHYKQSLEVLKFVKDTKPSIYTKSSLMLGLGETDSEIRQTLKDLRGIQCDVVTFGQYLRPTQRHLKVETFVSPEKFKNWQKEAEEMGFLYVASGPLVRSSYRAGEFFMKGLIKKGEPNGFKKYPTS